jgi:hypothetical protein
MTRATHLALGGLLVLLAAGGIPLATGRMYSLTRDTEGGFPGVLDLY